jgi:hypothetical protein
MRGPSFIGLGYLPEPHAAHLVDLLTGMSLRTSESLTSPALRRFPSEIDCLRNVKNEAILYRPGHFVAEMPGAQAEIRLTETEIQGKKTESLACRPQSDLLRDSWIGSGSEIRTLGQFQ